MDRETRRQLERYRHDEAGPFESTFIDDVIAGEFDRRELLRRASILGLSVPMVAILLRAGALPAPASSLAIHSSMTFSSVSSGNAPWSITAL